MPVTVRDRDGPDKRAAESLGCGSFLPLVS
jgi:hypothetical protein